MAEPKVLIVDDEDGVRRIVWRALEREGVETVEAVDGEEALALLDDDVEIGVVVLDWHLPGISGLDVLRRVRDDGRELHVIVFTGAGTEADRAQVIAAGADDYLVKAVATNELVRRVAAALDGRGAPRVAVEAPVERAQAAEPWVRAIAHDLQNVFTVLTGYLDLVETSLADPKALDRQTALADLQMMADASRRGAELAGRLLHGPDTRPSAPPSPDGALRADGELVLLVEDDADLRHTTERVLSEAGYRVLSAADTETALALHRARRDDIVLVLTDAVVPGSDPGAVAARLSAVDPSMPVVVMSGYGDALRDLAPGLDRAITIVDKPFTGDRLLAELRRVLEPTSAG